MAAIYQWFDGLIEVQIWTTTPYPIEVIEGIEIACDLAECYLTPISGEAADFNGTFLSGSLTQILISYGPNDEAADLNGTFLSGSLYQVLISYGPNDEAADFSGTFLSGVLDEKLVTAYAPDEGIEVACDLIPGSCSMTPV